MHIKEKFLIWKDCGMREGFSENTEGKTSDELEGVHHALLGMRLDLGDSEPGFAVAACRSTTCSLPQGRAPVLRARDFYDSGDR